MRIPPGTLRPRRAQRPCRPMTTVAATAPASVTNVRGRTITFPLGIPEPWLSMESCRRLGFVSVRVGGEHRGRDEVGGVGFPITQARMRNLLKRFVASPMRRRDYLLAHVLARLLGVVPEVVLPLGFGALAF